tara:strand:- start:384 stop:710 length:327 start_codon:yes stop_codon:yes gene_type:complete
MKPIKNKKRIDPRYFLNEGVVMAPGGLALTSVDQFPSHAPSIKDDVATSLETTPDRTRKIFNTNNGRLIAIDQEGNIFFGKEEQGAVDALKAEGYSENMNLNVPGSNR